MNDYYCWGIRELIERIEKMEGGLLELVKNWDYTDSQKNKSELIRILKDK